MEKQQPCYLCLGMSVLLSVAMIVMTVRFGQWFVGLFREK